MPRIAAEDVHQKLLVPADGADLAPNPTISRRLARSMSRRSEESVARRTSPGASNL